MPSEPSDDEKGSSFEVVEVSSLPNTDRAGTMTVQSATRPCGCRYCEGDWLKIAAASVIIHEEGIDPLDSAAVATRAISLGIGGDDLAWLLSLFSPTEGIIHLRRRDQFTFKDGRHRVHALRIAGAPRVVVYTGKGELPLKERA